MSGTLAPAADRIFRPEAFTPAPAVAAAMALAPPEKSLGQ